MKKVLSWILFIVTVIIFVFDIYATVCGTIDVKNQFDRIDSMGGSGVDYFGVGADILIIGVILITFIGLISCAVSWKCAQNRAIRITSIALFILFILMIPTILACFCFAYM
ncbi:MAG: hypothetical protein PUB93_03095 [Firmicutes bacterium]|nr:hypothetical protein [Bacillota bacterium]